MKRKTALCLAAAIVLSLTLFAHAAGGDSSDPLVSLSYLTGIFTKNAEARIEEKLDASDAALLGSAGEDGSLSAGTSLWTEQRLKENDVLTEELIRQLTPEQQEICNQLNRRTEFRVLRTTYGLHTPQQRPVQKERKP